MRKKSWISLTAFLAAILMLNSAAAVMPVYAEEAVVATAITQETETYSGTCGENATWTYDKSTKTLTISGTGSVETYVQSGVAIKTPQWLAIEGYMAKHVVINEGITSVGDGFVDFCFGYGSGNEERTLQVAKSVTEMDLGLLPTSTAYQNVTFYGTVGSWFYDQTYRSNRFIDIETGKLQRVPTSGVYTDGAEWNYDTETKTLVISGNGKITDAEFTGDFGYTEKAEKVIIGKDVILPEDKLDSNGENTFLLGLLGDATSENGMAVYLYHGSDADTAYQKIIADRVAKGWTEEEVRKAYPATYLDATPLCGDVNLDGRVDITDAVLLSKAVSGSVEVNDVQKSAMDCDGDGEISSNDATTLMQFLVHAVDSLPVK